MQEVSYFFEIFLVILVPYAILSHNLRFGGFHWLKEDGKLIIDKVS